MVRLKAIKIRKSDLNKAPEDFLRKFGAVSKETGRAYPTQVFISYSDYAVMKKNFRRFVKKNAPGISKRKLDESVGMHFLQYGPNDSLGSAVQPGYLLIDVEGIEQNIALDQIADLNEAIGQPYQQTLGSKVRAFFQKNFGAPPLPKV